MKQTFDFIVIGSGIAGLNAALTLANHGTVLIMTKKKLTDSATQLAQGGIAAVTNKEDSIDSHVQDTLIAGSYYNKKETIDFLVNKGKKAIDHLQELGVP